MLAPHIYWLMNTGYQPFSYALIAHGGSTLAGALAANAEYVLGALGYMALPVAVYWLALRPARATWREALWPPEPGRRMLVLLLATPLVLPALTAPLIEAKLTAIWTIQGWFLLPIVLLAPSSARLPRRAANGVALAIAGLTLALLIAAPAIAWNKHKQGTNEGRNYFPALGQEVTRRWHALTGRRLSIMLGDQSLSTAFYSADHPDTVPGFHFWAAPWVTPQRLAREGWAAVCALDEPWCVAGAAQRIADNPAAQRFQFEIVPRFFGTPGEPRSFVLVVAPPK